LDSEKSKLKIFSLVYFFLTMKFLKILIFFFKIFSYLFIYINFFLYLIIKNYIVLNEKHIKSDREL